VFGRGVTRERDGFLVALDALFLVLWQACEVGREFQSAAAARRCARAARGCDAYLARAAGCSRPPEATTK